MNLRKFKTELQKQFPNCVISLQNFQNYVWVNKISVKEKEQGTGTKIMNAICNFCDLNHVYCKLLPSDNFGSNLDRLVNFYSKFGFTFFDDEMIRKPKRLN